jgi:cobalt-precorrin 5A hydrolase
VIVAGFGLRATAREDTLRAALARVGAPTLSALAAPADKADHSALQSLARAMGLPVLAIQPDQLRVQATATQSSRQPARYGTGSVAEAAALAACGPGARLIHPRLISPCGTATVAIAQGPQT